MSLLSDEPPPGDLLAVKPRLRPFFPEGPMVRFARRYPRFAPLMPRGGASLEVAPMRLPSGVDAL
eukprot:12755354-Alexandrium_andersonii.AAC.1